MQDSLKTGGSKMNLRIAICDDEIRDIKTIEKHILQYNIESNDNIVLSSFLMAEDLLIQHNEAPFDAVFLDIEMPDINGMELAKQLRQEDDNLLIVFTTSYPEYMQDSFEVQPFQFLCKPIDYKNIEKVLSSIISKFSRSKHTIVMINNDNEKHFINLKEIYYVSVQKGQKGTLSYHLADHDLTSKGTLSSIESELMTYGFISPARGMIVNLNHISSMNSERILLNNGTEIPISRRRLKEIQKLYTNHIIQIMT